MDKKSQTFAVTGPTEHDHVLGTNRSTNYFLAPVNLMSKLKGTDSIKMNMLYGSRYYLSICV